MIERITEQVEVNQAYLEDVDVSWISLVDKAANRSPFKIVKNDKTEVIMEDVVQSVIIPSAKDISYYDTSWAKCKATKVEKTDTYTKHVFMPMSELDETTIRLEKLEDDALAVVGKAVALKADAIIFKSPLMDKQVQLGEGYVATFRDTFANEFNNVWSVVNGTMELTDMDNKRKRSIVTNALDAFKTFVSAGLDMSSVPVIFKKDNDSEVNMKDNDATVVKNDAEVIETPKAPDTAFVAGSSDLLEKLLLKMDAVLEKVTASPEVAKADEVVPAEPVAVEKADNTDFSKVIEKLELLEKRIEKMDSSIPESNNGIDSPEEEPQDDNPFSGILFKRQK